MATAEQKQAAGARIQSLFREVNERIDQIGAERELEGEVLCECAATDCAETITLTHDEYEAVRGIPTLFFVVPGHEVPEIEVVIGGNGRYLVVEKFGEGGRAAVRLDPRRPSPQPFDRRY